MNERERERVRERERKLTSHIQLSVFREKEEVDLCGLNQEIGCPILYGPEPPCALEWEQEYDTLNIRTYYTPFTLS